MSLYNEHYDEALSRAQWVSKACGGRTYLFKYAPHPDRKGYLLAATDLETVTFEEMSASSVPTRLGIIATMDGEEDPTAGMGYNEQQEKSEETLKTLAGVFDGGWSKTEVERDVDDYFDAVFVVKHGSFKWLFQMTELRGRQPLSFISKQLLFPWASLLAQDRGVSIDSASPAAAVGAIISDAGVARALRRVTGAPPPRPTPTPGPPTRRSSPTRPSPPPAKVRKAASPPPARTPRRAVSPERTPLPRPPSPARAGQAGLSLIPPSSPTPVARRRVYDFAAGILPSSEPDHSEEAGITPDDSFPPPMASGRSGFPSAAQSDQRKSRSPLNSSPPLPPSGLPSSEAGLPAHTTSENTSSNVPSSTMDPLIPTQEHKKKKKKKKDPKKLEEEEEAEANKRREEMKKRMAAGGGGGRLGRRRA